MNKQASLVALLTASFAGIRFPTAPVRIEGRRPCPKCGAKAIWHATTAYCTKSRCGWFEVVQPKPVRIWRLLERGPAHNCHECGRIIVPDDPRWFDEVSFHIARHVECHEKAEAGK